jgi:hypothetical protein
MALLGLDSLLLASWLLPYVRLSRFWDATHWALGRLTMVVPAEHAALAELLRREAELLARQARLPAAQAARQVEVRGPEGKGALRGVRVRVVLSEQEFSVGLEQVLLVAGVALGAFFCSEMAYCASNNRWFPGRQSGTALFLAGVAFNALVALVTVSARMWRRVGFAEAQLSAALGLLSLSLCLGGLAAASGSARAAVPDLDLVRALGGGAEAARGAGWWAAALALSGAGALFIALALMPGFRFARVYKEVVENAAEREQGGCPKPPLLQASMHFLLLTPLLVALLYVDPLVATPLLDAGWLPDRAAWVRLRAHLVLALTALRLALAPRLVQAFLDSAILVTGYMMQDAKRFPRSAVDQFVANHYWLASHAAMQFVLPTLVALPLAALRPRLAGDGWGLCAAAFHAAGATRPAPLANTPPLGAIAAMRDMLPEALRGQADEAVLRPQLLATAVDALIVWTNLAWFVCMLLGLAYFRGVSLPRHYALVNAAPALGKAKPAKQE